MGTCVETSVFHPKLFVSNSTKLKNPTVCKVFKLSKGAKIRKGYNQVPHLTQDTNGKATNPQPDPTNESQEVSPFPAGDQKPHMNRGTQRYSKHDRKKHKRSTKEAPPQNGQQNIPLKGPNRPHGTNPTPNPDVDQDT